MPLRAFLIVRLTDDKVTIRNLGALMVTGGVVLLGFSLVGGIEAGTEMNPEMELRPGAEEPRMEEMDPGMESM
jgi:hypothetical protein